VATFRAAVLQGREDARPRGRRTVPAVALAIVTLAACGGSAVTSRGWTSPPPKAAASAATGPAGSMADWQARGATEVPPRSVLQVSLQGIQVVNQTAGAVSDADARAWAQAFQRSTGLLYWAVARMQDAFLQRSGLSSAPFAVFGPNLDDIILARRAGTRVEYTQQTVRRLVVRPVPQSLQPVFAKLRFVWKPYAIYLDALGPSATVWVDAQGNRTTKSEIAAGVPIEELLGGELSHDALFGDVWVRGSDWNCGDPSSRQGLAPACNP
jgi:hypothetical protein